MQADDDSKTTLTKWPFILGDLLLVATALAIAITANWHLTEWQIAYCVVAVALGALLFVLPYIVEFRVRVIEEQQDRAADIRILDRDLSGAMQAVDVLDARLRALESVAAEPALPEPVLPEPVDLGPLNDKLDDCAARLELLERAEQKAVEVAAEPEIVVESPVEEAVPESKAVIRETPKRTKAPAVQRQKREPRARQAKAETRLIKRALKEKQDGVAAAVSRIIESRSKIEPEKVETEELAAEQAVEVIAEPVSSMPEPSEPSEPEPEVVQTKPKAKKKVARKKKELVAVGEASVVEASPVEEVSVVAEPVSETSSPATDGKKEGDSNLGDLLFDEDPAPAVIRKKKRAKKKDAVVTASVFIGIGNKPYLRGSGGGLNWETGVAMDFEEIGKWSWLAPADFDGEIEVQVYRNDEDPDTLGKYTLEAGQKLDLWPVF